VRCFGIKVSDFFVLVEKLHRAVQQHMHIDPLVGAIGRLLRDLKERAFKGDGVVLSALALLETLFVLSLASSLPSSSGLSSSYPDNNHVAINP